MFREISLLESSFHLFPANNIRKIRQNYFSANNNPLRASSATEAEPSFTDYYRHN